MRVALFTRRPRAKSNFSIESIVAGIAQRLHGDYQPQVVVARYESRGVLPRLYNMVEAAVQQGDVNHVTGDIHFVALLLDGRRTLLTVHDCGRIVGQTDLASQVIKWLWFILPVRHCARTTVVSEATKRQLTAIVPDCADRIAVVPTFISDAYQRRPRPFHKACPQLLQVGTKDNKNLLRVAQALQGIPCHLHVVGVLNDDQRQALQDAGIDYTNHVAVTDARMVELYEQSDLIVFASTFEGFGMPIIEANRVGRAVVTSNVTSMPEVAGDAACLVDPFDVDSIRAGIERVIHDDIYRQHLIERGFANAERFSASHVIQCYEKLYDELAQRPRRGLLRSGVNALRAALH